MDCPTCSGSLSEVIESRRCQNGTQRRRHECLDCGNRWTTWDGARPERKPPTGHGRKGRLTADQVRYILLAPRGVTHAELGREFGFSGEFIRMIRIGNAYQTVHPEIARWCQPAPKTAGRSCYRCSHWVNDDCSFGFPDPQLEGPTFARYCYHYEVSQSISRDCPSSDQ